MPTRQDEQGRWHAEACVRRRRLHRRLPPGSTARDAKRVEAELVRALHAQAPKRDVQIPGDPPLLHLLADYAERHAPSLRSPDTARHHAIRIAPWCEGKRASETRQVVAKAVSDMRAHYKPATINRSLGALKKALRDAWDRGATPVDYSGLVRRLPENNLRAVTLDAAQVDAIASRASAPVRAAIWIALLTGLRRGEIVKIAAEDIGADVIRLPAGNTKTLRHREIPITPPLRPWLAHLPLGITAEGVKSGFRRARDAAGLPDVHFHDLRRSCGTILIRAGVPLHVVSKILGHSSTSVTEARYAFLDDGAMAEALGMAFGAVPTRTPAAYTGAKKDAEPHAKAAA